MTAETQSWFTALATPLLGMALIAFFFRHRLRWAYHYMRVLYEFRADPEARSLFILLSMLGAWTLLGGIYFAITITGASLGHWSYWKLPISFAIWLLFAVVLAVLWNKVLAVPKDAPGMDEASRAKFGKAMTKALRARLGGGGKAEG